MAGGILIASLGPVDEGEVEVGVGDTGEDAQRQRTGLDPPSSSARAVAVRPTRALHCPSPSVARAMPYSLPAATASSSASVYSSSART
jgi:hypothetical protein